MMFTTKPVLSSVRSARIVRCHTASPTDAKQVLHDAIQTAEYVCADAPLDEIECAIAWDNVDEIRRGVYLREEALADPLEAFCVENEDADECRIFDL